MYRDPEFTRFAVEPMTGAMGATIHGLDLAAWPDDATIEDVKRALFRYNALAIRDQSFTPQRYHEVARRFGPFSGNIVHQPLDGLEDIVRFERQPDDTGMVIGEEWHMDLAWMERPPGITMLYGEVIPPVGGDTCFASLEHLYLSLSPAMREMLLGLTGIHSGRGVFQVNVKHKGLTRAEGRAVEDIEREHPVICRNPVTGRPYVFIAGVLSRFKGMTEAESRPIIDFLMNRAIRPEFTCRLRWQPGTLTMWANPFVLHTAIGDYPGHRRVTYRSTVEGWIPEAWLPNDRATTTSRAA